MINSKNQYQQQASKTDKSEISQFGEILKANSDDTSAEIGGSNPRYGRGGDHE